MKLTSLYINYFTKKVLKFVNLKFFNLLIKIEICYIL